MKKVKTFRGWIIAKEEGPETILVLGVPFKTDLFFVFTAEEWSYGEGYRTPEFECGSIEECCDNVRSY